MKSPRLVHARAPANIMLRLRERAEAPERLISLCLGGYLYAVRYSTSETNYPIEPDTLDVTTDSHAWHTLLKWLGYATGASSNPIKGLALTMRLAIFATQQIIRLCQILFISVFKYLI